VQLSVATCRSANSAGVSCFNDVNLDCASATSAARSSSVKAEVGALAARVLLCETAARGVARVPQAAWSSKCFGSSSSCDSCGNPTTETVLPAFGVAVDRHLTLFRRRETGTTRAHSLSSSLSRKFGIFDHA
jgi:hypothetical protein